MIRGRYSLDGRRRALVSAYVSIPSQNLLGEVIFLIDTGADTTVLAPRDALKLQLDVAPLAPGPASSGIGGIVETRTVEATILLNHLSYTIPLRILKPQYGVQAHYAQRIPSLLGRDILSRLALFMDNRTDRVLLLEPHEVDALPL